MRFATGWPETTVGNRVMSLTPPTCAASTSIAWATPGNRNTSSTNQVSRTSCRRDIPPGPNGDSAAGGGFPGSLIRISMPDARRRRKAGSARRGGRLTRACVLAVRAGGLPVRDCGTALGDEILAPDGGQRDHPGHERDDRGDQDDPVQPVGERRGGDELDLAPDRGRQVPQQVAGGAGLQGGGDLWPVPGQPGHLA